MRSTLTWMRAVGCAAVAMTAVLAPTAARAKTPDCQVEILDTGQKFTPNLQRALDVVANGQTIQVKGICRGNFATGSFAQPVKQFTIVGKATNDQPLATLDGGTLGRTLLLQNVNLTLRSLALTGGNCGTGCAGHTAVITSPFSGPSFAVLTDVTIRRPGSTDSAGNAVHISAPALLDRLTVEDVGMSALVLRRNATIRDSVFDRNLVALRRPALDAGTITFEGVNTFRDNEIGVLLADTANPVGQPADFAVGVGATVVFDDNTTDCDPEGLLPGFC